MATIYRIPTYTYYDNNTQNFQSSMTYICNSALLNKLKEWYLAHQGAVMFQLQGTNILDAPWQVNNFLEYSLISKKSGEWFLPWGLTSTQRLKPFLADLCSKMYVPFNYHLVNNALPVPTKLIGLNNKQIYWESDISYGAVNDILLDDIIDASLGNYQTYTSVQSKYNTANLRIRYDIFPDDFFLGNDVNPIYKTGGEKANEECYCCDIMVWASDDGGNAKITKVEVFVTDTLATFAQKAYYLRDFTLKNSGATTIDTDNPYGEGGSATIGGGDGTLDPGRLDEVDGTEVPDLPTLGAVDTGFISLYNPTASILKSLYQFLWSNMFDVDTFKKLFADPMECIISLGILPCLPAGGGNKNINFGNVDTGVNCSVLTTQYAQVDCGSVEIEKYVGSFLDYSPFVKISLFLPFIGFVHLGVDDLMGASINVTYNVDCLSGDCIAFVSHSSRGVLYSYNGNCRTELPVTGANYTGALKNYYESVSGIIPSTISGASAGGAAGALGGFVGGALDAASDVLFNSKPDFQRSGSLAGGVGMLGVQKPFVVIERPRYSVPNKVEQYAGQVSNITSRLGDCSGFTAVEFVHLDNLNATSEEILEIESMLYKGVIL